ncbi:hypothetical protein P154DRAFT_564562 [Amniculicola lignicola CBS 123094]|uniref:Bacteriophage T5 Orf172 DNA-binding domain-containing protein n=1 Tax=Amniculicola lignicola CBS 123094 TaxID=1392246 RepID=A0A6A5WCR0_9PLEO|nr:hypothetical protein P154DRAFT_564562 [Amniculicola lignicola CBS 123094]
MVVPLHDSDDSQPSSPEEILSEGELEANNETPYTPPEGQSRRRSDYFLSVPSSPLDGKGKQTVETYSGGDGESIKQGSYISNRRNSNGDARTRRVKTDAQTDATPETHVLAAILNVLDGIKSGQREWILNNSETGVFQCVATTRRSNNKLRCKKSSEGHKTKGILQNILEALESPEDGSFGEIPRLVEDLVGSFLCPQYHYEFASQIPRLTGRKLHRAWLDLDSAQTNPSDNLGDSEQALKEFFNELQETKSETYSGNAKRETKAPDTKISLRPRKAASSDNGNTVVSPGSVTPALEKLTFQKWQPRRIENDTVYEAVQKVINKPFRDDEEDKGYIYMLKAIDTPGFIKIGLSKETSLHNRKKTLDREHGRTLKYVLKEKVLHIKQVEELIHAELKNNQHKCTKKYIKRAGIDKGGKKVCTGYQEWFEVAENEAKAVFFKWKDWIEQEPRPFEREDQDWEWNPYVCLPKGLCELARPDVKSPNQRAKGKYLLRSSAKWPSLASNRKSTKVRFSLSPLPGGCSDIQVELSFES